MDTHTGERESLPLFSRKRSAIPLMESSDYSPDRCDDGVGGEGEDAFFRTRPHVVYPFTNVEMCSVKGLHCCYVPLLLLLLLFGKRGRRRCHCWLAVSFCGNIPVPLLYYYAGRSAMGTENYYPNVAVILGNFLYISVWLVDEIETRAEKYYPNMC